MTPRQIEYAERVKEAAKTLQEKFNAVLNDKNNGMSDFVVHDFSLSLKDVELNEDCEDCPPGHCITHYNADGSITTSCE